MYNMIVHRIRYRNGTQYGVLCTDCTSVDVTAIGSHVLIIVVGKAIGQTMPQSHCAIINKWCYSKESGIKLQLIANKLRAGAEGDISFPRDMCCTCMCVVHVCVCVCVYGRTCMYSQGQVSTNKYQRNAGHSGVSLSATTAVSATTHHVLLYTLYTQCESTHNEQLHCTHNVIVYTMSKYTQCASIHNVKEYVVVKPSPRHVYTRQFRGKPRGRSLRGLPGTIKCITGKPALILQFQSNLGWR